MKHLYTTVLSILFVISAFANDREGKRIILVGDAGSSQDGKWPVLDAIKKNILLDSNTIIIYLGDNEYDAHKGAYPSIDAQAAVVDNTEAKAYFIPGNSEWKNGNKKGLKSVKAENKYIKDLNRKNVFIYPEDGCAGVAKTDFGDDITILFMDTQWWLHKHDKPGIESKCDSKTREQVLDELKNTLDDNADKLVIFAGHHPFRSTGLHANSFGLKQHIFPLTDINGLRNFYLPLPIVGSLYPISRNFLYSPQDRIHPAYEDMTQSVDGVLQFYPFVIRAAAHDHSQQLIKSRDDKYYIVSGSGSHSERARNGWGTEYTSEKKGFTVLDISADKKVKTTFYSLEKNGGVKKNFDKELFSFAKPPARAEDTAKTNIAASEDSVVVAVNTYYDSVSGFKRYMFGSNYRKEWATPVKMRVFRMDKEKGGLTIEAIGGGKQSKSLHMVDAEGKKWTLRTVNKDPEKAIPENLRGTVAKEIVQDLISTAHPYAPLTVPPISEALDVVHTNPEILFVPNDGLLGIYAPLFENTVCMLEERNPSRDDNKGDSGWEMLNKTIDKDDYTVDQKSFFTARMLDFLVADFDRHYDQWKWGRMDTGKGKVYYPIPKDRDQTFFYSDGFMAKVLAYDALPFLKGLRYTLPQIRWLGFTARDIDRLYLNELDINDWRKLLADFRDKLPDPVIEDAIHKMPPEIYPIHGPEITAKLKSRRDLMPERAIDYYRFLANYVTVTGSNKNDYFQVSNADSGILVKVYDRTSTGDTGFLKYSRVFNDDETEEVWFYGFNGDDYFDIAKDADSKIKFRVVGGRGADTFNARGHIRNFIYDRKDGGNVVLQDSRTRRRMQNNSDVYRFNFREQTYHNTNFPVLSGGYNPDDLLLVGVGVMRTTRGFRKEPFATRQKLSAIFSFFNSAYQVRYDGEFRDVFREIDLLTLAQIKNPALDFFFGLGNETIKDPTKKNRYYQARYNYLQGDVLFRKRISNDLIGISLGPTYYRYWNNYDDNEGKVLARPNDVMLDSSEVYTNRLYAGGKLSVRINNVDNKLLPTHGIDWKTDLSVMTGLDESTLPVSRLQSDAVIYATLLNPGNLTAILRFGGGHIFSEHFEYFQALRLGANNFLRGYRRDRFAGSSSLYGSAELRLKLATIKSRVFPGDIGLIGFDDIGRVWLKGEQSDKWHNSYGGGIYYTPFNMVAIGATMAFSEEDKLFNASVGTNIRIFF